MGQAMGALFSTPFDLLLGRKTYEIFAAHWPYVGPDDPIGPVFDKANKYVVTRGDEPLEWVNSYRLGSIADVEALKNRDGPDLLIQGSSTLYPALLGEGLIDRLFVMTFPVVLGSGKRLFGPGTPAAAWKMIDHQLSTTGVIMATYAPAGRVPIGSFQLDAPSPAEERRQQRMAREG
jgi:dihydrofolate reductase